MAQLIVDKKWSDIEPINTAQSTFLMNRNASAYAKTVQNNIKNHKNNAPATGKYINTWPTWLMEERNETNHLNASVPSEV